MFQHFITLEEAFSDRYTAIKVKQKVLPHLQIKEGYQEIDNFAVILSINHEKLRLIV